MGVPKLTGFLIALVLAGFFIVAITFYIRDLSNNYGATFDNSTLTKYNYLHNLSSDAEDIQDKVVELEGDQSLADILGLYFTGAWQAMIITFNSFGIFFMMLGGGINDLGLGVLTNPLILTLSTIVIILFVIGIFIAAVVKRDL